MNYNLYLKKIQKLSRFYKIEKIGKSRFNRDIFAVCKISPNAKFSAILVGGVHAREYISSELLIKFLEKRLFSKCENFNVIVVPFANPDGISLCLNGILTIPPEHFNETLSANGENLDFSLWKANGIGVDINNNFDALFGKHISSLKPASQGYAGSFPESEPETQALVSVAKRENPFITISYHSKGEEIYYNFFQKKEALERDKIIAQRFAKSTGYKIKNPENSSSGGFKDWCINSLKIPSLTIEVGNDKLSHPIKENHLKEIYKQNKDVAKDLEFAYNVFKEALCLKKNL